MNARRTLAVALKEGREIVRDRLFCALAFLMPVMLMVMFGYGMSNDVQNLPFAVVDYDHSAMSRDYVHHFTGSRYFDFQGYLRSPRQADRLLAEGTIRILIVIPERFQEQLLKGRAVQIQTLMDGTFPQTVRTAMGYVEAINGAANDELQVPYVARHLGVPLERAEALLQPVRVEVRYLYNQEMRSVWAVAPSLIMLITTLMAPLLTALGVVREKETGAIYNIYSSTVSRAEFLAGKLLPYLLISFINAIVLWLIAVYYFRAPFKGSLPFFALATLLYVICASSYGLLLSLLVRTQRAALMIAVMFSFMIVTQFSGIFTPVSSLTGASYVIAHLFPPMYYNNIVEGVFLKGMGVTALWGNAVVILCFSAAVLAISHALFRKRAPGERTALGSRLSPLRSSKVKGLFVEAERREPSAESRPMAAIWLRQLHVMAAKELLQLGRDTTLLLFIVYIFTVEILVAGGASSELRNAPVLVHDADHSAASRELIYRFRLPYFRMAGEVTHPSQAQRLLDQGKARLVLDVPEHFEETLRRAEHPATVQLLVDTSKANGGYLAASYGARIAAGFSQEWAQQSGLAALGAGRSARGSQLAAPGVGLAFDLAGAERRAPSAQRLQPLPVIENQRRIWYNADLNDAWFGTISELLTMLTVACLLLPAAAMVREKERGTIEQLLVSPLSPFQVMVSKVLAMVLVTLMGTAVSLFAIMRPLFALPVSGSLALFFALTALYAFTNAGLGLAAATFARNSGQVGMLVLLIVMPIIILSGLHTPVESMPAWLRCLVTISPLQQFIEIAYGILLRGSGLNLLWKPALTMALLGGGLFTLGTWRFRRQFR